MGKLGGLAAGIALIALLGSCSAPQQPAEPAAVQQVAQVSTSVQDSMLLELKPVLTTLQGSDAELVREAYEACANLLFRSKDSYREAVLKEYSDVAVAVDHLTVAAAAKKYICPAT